MIACIVSVLDFDRCVWGVLCSLQKVVMMCIYI